MRIYKKLSINNAKLYKTNSINNSHLVLGNKQVLVTNRNVRIFCEEKIILYSKFVRFNVKKNYVI